jgi:hypothetical protein
MLRRCRASGPFHRSLQPDAVVHDANSHCYRPEPVRSVTPTSGGGASARPALSVLWRPHVRDRDLRGRLPATPPANGASRRNPDRHLMSAVATSRTRIVKRVSRWSQSRHDDARPNSYPAALSTRQSSPKAIVIAAQASPRPTSARHLLTAALSRLASVINVPIKSP